MKRTFDSKFKAQVSIEAIRERETLNSDLGGQFTCKYWIAECAKYPEMVANMDGRGRAKDNIWIERFWKTIKYEYIYINLEDNVTDLFYGIRRFIEDYNYHKTHHGIERQIPAKLYFNQKIPA